MKISLTGNRFQDKLIEDIDALADSARIKIAGDGIRVKEYELAQTDAINFKNAGYVGTPGPGVTTWAQATGWTYREAAEDILSANDRWQAALIGIRGLRLRAKQDILRATTGPQKQEIYNQFAATLTTMMQGVA